MSTKKTKKKQATFPHVHMSDWFINYNTHHPQWAWAEEARQALAESEKFKMLDSGIIHKSIPVAKNSSKIPKSGSEVMSEVMLHSFSILSFQVDLSCQNAPQESQLTRILDFFQRMGCFTIHYLCFPKCFDIHWHTHTPNNNRWIMWVWKCLCCAYWSKCKHVLLSDISWLELCLFSLLPLMDEWTCVWCDSRQRCPLFEPDKSRLRLRLALMTNQRRGGRTLAVKR